MYQDLKKQIRVLKSAFIAMQIQQSLSCLHKLSVLIRKASSFTMHNSTESKIHTIQSRTYVAIILKDKSFDK